MSEEFRVVTQDIVNVTVTNSAQQSAMGNERRFPKDLTISKLKGKLELVTGANSLTMRLELYTKDDKFVCELSNNDALLGSYPIDDGMRIHVVDKFNIYNEFESAKVEKFELTPEQYAQKPDSLKAFLMKNKLGKYNEEETKRRKEQLANELAEEEKLLQDISISSRCLVTIPNGTERRGTVLYTGKMEGRTGYWVGIKFDEPLGKNDGSYEGKQYFECPDKYGGFVKPTFVLTGDYPEIEYDFDDEI